MAGTQIRMTCHQWTALTLTDFGFNLPDFADEMPHLAERGWVRLYAGRWQVTGAGRRAMRGLPPEQPVRYGCDTDRHASSAADACRWPVHCAFCGKGLDRWYYGSRAPLCPWCRDKDGPVLPPPCWEMASKRVGETARQVWEEWAGLIVTAKDGR